MATIELFWQIQAEYRRKNLGAERILAIVCAPALQQAVNKVVRRCKFDGGTRIRILSAFKSLVTYVIP